MPNMLGRVFGLLSQGATIVRAKDVGYIVLERGTRRTRKAKVEKKEKVTVK